MVQASAAIILFNGNNGPTGSDMSAWAYSNQIQVDNSGNLFDLNDQIRIDLNPTNFDFSLAKSDGSDIRFTLGSVTVILDHWIQSYDPINGVATIWVKSYNIYAGTVGSIQIFYGNPAAAASSSFANTMTRFQTSEPSSAYVVRFNDGAGSSAVNIGASSGTMSIIGGKTWNSNDIWGESTKSLTLDGSSGYIEKAGLLDSWGTEGHLQLSFILNSTAADQTIFSKVNRLAPGSGDDGDYVQLYYNHVTGFISLKFSANSVATIATYQQTTLATGVRYTISLIWNTKLSDNYGGWMIVFLNGNREVDTFNVVSYPPDGSAKPFRIGANSNKTTGAAESFASITVNDFVYQSVQVLWAKIFALHQWRNYFQIDEKSKWTVSKTSAWGGDPHYDSEPSLYYENGIYYVLTSHWDGSIFSLYLRQTTSLEPNVSPVWTNIRKIAGGGTGGESGTAIRGVLGKVNGTYYIFHRDASAAGVIYCIESTDLNNVAFSNKVAVLPVPGSGPGQYGFFNTSFPIDGGDGFFYINVDYLDTGGTNIYLSVVARCATINGTYTLFGTNPKTGQIPGNGTGLVGGPSTFKSGTIHSWLGASPVHPASGSLPNDMYRSDSVDWDNWTNTQLPVLIREYPQAYDQKSDPAILEVNGNSYLLSNDVDNGERPGFGIFVSYIGYAKFNGPISKLTKDLTVALSNTPSNTALALSPLVYLDNSSYFMASDGSLWIDRMNGLNLAKASAEHPVYTPNSLNGRPAFVFDANDFLTRAKLSGIENIGALSFWFVGKGWTMSQDDGSTNNGRITMQQASGTVFALPNGVIGYGSVAKTDVFNYTVIVFDGSQTGNSNRLKVYYNGVLQTLSFSGTVPAVTGQNASSSFFLHKALGAGGAGSMCEMGIVTRAITGAEITSLNAFLSSRYAL